MNKTDRYLEYLDFILEFWKIYRYSPSIRDIMEHFHTSTSVVHYHLSRLEVDGLIMPRGGSERISRNIVPMQIVEVLDEYFSRS